MRVSLSSIKCSAPLLLASDYCRALFRCLNLRSMTWLPHARQYVVGSLEESPNTWLMIAKNAFVGWALNVRVSILLKGTVEYRKIRELQAKSIFNLRCPWRRRRRRSFLNFLLIGGREIRNISDNNKQEIFIVAGIFIAVFEDNYVQ